MNDQCNVAKLELNPKDLSMSHCKTVHRERADIPSYILYAGNIYNKQLMKGNK